MFYDKMDGGYGSMGNTVMYIFLSTLPSNTKKDYENYLKKKNAHEYEEYKEWEKKIIHNRKV